MFIIILHVPILRFTFVCLNFVNINEFTLHTYKIYVMWRRRTQWIKNLILSWFRWLQTTLCYAIDLYSNELPISMASLAHAFRFCLHWNHAISTQIFHYIFYIMNRDRNRIKEANRNDGERVRARKEVFSAINKQWKNKWINAYFI